MNFTNSSPGHNVTYNEIISYLSLIGDILAIIGIIKNHLKLYPIEAVCFFLICFIQIVASIIRFLRLFLGDYLHESVCYINTFGECFFLIIVFSIMIVSFNRVCIMKTSLYDKKPLTLSRLKGISRYNFVHIWIAYIFRPKDFSYLQL
jgi:heme/copper-type cytochrome/quinol oxidase subunit 4